MKINEKHKRLLLITGLAFACVLLSVVVFIPKNKSESEPVSVEENKTDEETIIVSEIKDNEVTDTETSKETDGNESEVVANDDIVKTDSNQDVVVELNDLEKDTTEPVKPIVEGDSDKNTSSVETDSHEVPENEVMTDKETKPTYAPEQVEPQKEEIENKKEPKGGSINEDGQVYVPGFGYITSSGENEAGTFDSDGSLDKQVGTMD